MEDLNTFSEQSEGFICEEMNMKTFVNERLTSLLLLGPLHAADTRSIDPVIQILIHFFPPKWFKSPPEVHIYLRV